MCLDADPPLVSQAPVFLVFFQTPCDSRPSKLLAPEHLGKQPLGQKTSPLSQLHTPAFPRLPLEHSNPHLTFSSSEVRVLSVLVDLDSSHSSGIRLLEVKHLQTGG